MKNWYFIIILVLGLVGLVYWLSQSQSSMPATDSETTLTQPTSKQTTQEGESMDKQEANKEVQLTTSKGTITLELFSQKAPKTVANFLTKAQSGFYEGLTFHRVEDWVVQGGDPAGNGTGGGKMPTELNDEPFVRGSLGVARGPDIKVSNDAQFFICTKDCDWLTGQYTNFGKVTKGIEIIDQIAIGDKITGLTPVE